MCRKDEWNEIHQMVQDEPEIATTPMIMDNHISTTILHQAITSKASTVERARVIQAVIERSPSAATIKNGYGSLPLHVISQRNTKMDSQTKERLIHALVKAFPKALMTEGGVGRRTPLHIAFTDYISPQLAKMMIAKGSSAAFMKDKKGWLPIHVAVSRHCSPEKLRLLLKVNNDLHAKTALGETLLQLAKKTATRSHPNFALIAELERQLGGSEPPSEEERTEPIPVAFPKARLARRGTRKRKAEAADLLLHFSRAQLKEDQEEEEEQRQYQLSSFRQQPTKSHFRPVHEEGRHQPYNTSYGNEQKHYYPHKDDRSLYDASYRSEQKQQHYYSVKDEVMKYSSHAAYRAEQKRQELFHSAAEEQKQGHEVFYSSPHHAGARYPPHYASPGYFEPKPVYYPPRQMFYSQPPQAAPIQRQHPNQDAVGEIVQL